MADFKIIAENFPLDKFEGLTKLIISLRGKLNTITTNNKNGYIRIGDHDGSLFVSRTLLKSPPERAREVEEILTEITYEMAKSSTVFILKKRNILKHETNKNEEELICAGVAFNGKYIAVGGLMAHENLALAMLFISFATEEYFSPNLVPIKQLDQYGNLFVQIINKSEIRSIESEIYKKAICLIEEILCNKRTIWPTKSSMVKSQSN